MNISTSVGGTGNTPVITNQETKIDSPTSKYPEVEKSNQLPTHESTPVDNQAKPHPSSPIGQKLDITA